jgi:hypothetical protein
MSTRSVEIKVRRKRTIYESRTVVIDVPQDQAHEFAGQTPTEEDWVMTADHLADNLPPGTWTQERDTHDVIEELEAELIDIKPPLNEPSNTGFY